MAHGDSINKNGLVVMHAIRDIPGPASLQKIVDYIANKTGMGPSEDLIRNVKKTTKGCMRYGFVRKENDRYFVHELEGSWSVISEIYSSADDRSETSRRRRSRRSSHSTRSRSRSGSTTRSLSSTRSRRRRH